jgi:hypothetical protein
MKDFFGKIETILKIFVLMVLAIFAASIVVEATDSALAGIIFFIICVIVTFYYFNYLRKKRLRDFFQGRTLENIKLLENLIKSNTSKNRRSELEHLRLAHIELLEYFRKSVDPKYSFEYMELSLKIAEITDISIEKK